MAHELDVEVIAKDFLVPEDGLFRLVNLSLADIARYFSCKAGRGGDDAFVMSAQGFVVSTRSMVVAIDPCFADYLDEVVIAYLVFGEENEVPSAFVYAVVLFEVEASACTIHLTSEDGLELLFFWFSIIDLVAIVEKLLDAKHVAVVSDGHAFHAVLDGFVHQLWHCCLSVKDAVLGVYV